MRRARFLVPLSLVQLFLLVFRSGKQSLWLDEVMSLDVARSSWAQMLAFFRQLPEQHPVYYIVLHYWIPLGTSEAMLRLPSALFAVATLWALYHLAERLFDEGVARISAVLLCFSPFYLYYGQEARMYTLLCFLAVLGSALLVAWVESGSRRTLVAYMITALFGVYTHLFYFFLLAAHWVYLILDRRAPAGRKRLLTGANLLVVLAYLPWASLILARGPSSQSWKGLQHIIFGVPYTFLRFSLGYSQVLANHGWKERIGELLLDNTAIIGVAVICFGTLGIVGLVRVTRSGRAGWFVISALLVPMMLATLLSFKVVLIGERYFIVSFPFFLIVLAGGLAALLRSPGRVRGIGFACAALFALIATKCLRDYYFSPSFGKEQWAAVADYLRAHADTTELIVVHSGFAANSLRYYYGEDRLERLRRSEEVAPTALAELPRYWLVLAHAADEAEYRKALSATHTQRLEQFFPLETGIRVLLLERRTELVGSLPERD
jgi:uncharacterized membrane protein